MLSALAKLFGIGAESRSGSGGGAFVPGPTAAGLAVTPASSENLATVLACVNAVASALASLPALVYRVGGAGRTEEAAHPVARLIRRPNAHQTWPDFIEFLLAQALLRGNALAVIESDYAGRPVALVPVPWGAVAPVLLPSGRLAYDVVAASPVWGASAAPRRYLDSEVLHLRDRSDDGLLGRSRLSRAAEVLGSALALQEWSGSVWRNGATPRGVIEMDKKFSDDGVAARIRRQVEDIYSGSRNAGRVAILEAGMKWQSVSISPEDAEVLASRRFTVEELCRLFNVPPPIVQAYQFNTFTNAAQASLWFAQLTLMPWARKLEAEFARSVFGADAAHALEIDMSGLMRGDYEARWKAHEIAVRNQILSAEEVREVEGWNPRGRETSAGPASDA